MWRSVCTPAHPLCIALNVSHLHRSRSVIDVFVFLKLSNRDESPPTIVQNLSRARERRLHLLPSQAAILVELRHSVNPNCTRLSGQPRTNFSSNCEARTTPSVPCGDSLSFDPSASPDHTCATRHSLRRMAPCARMSSSPPPSPQVQTHYYIHVESCLDIMTQIHTLTPRSTQAATKDAHTVIVSEAHHLWLFRVASLASVQRGRINVGTIARNREDWAPNVATHLHPQGNDAAAEDAQQSCLQVASIKALILCVVTGALRR